VCVCVCVCVCDGMTSLQLSLLQAAPPQLLQLCLHLLSALHHTHARTHTHTYTHAHNPTSQTRPLTLPPSGCAPTAASTLPAPPRCETAVPFECSAATWPEFPIGSHVLLQLAAPFVALPGVLPSLAPANAIARIANNLSQLHCTNPAHLHTRMSTGWCMFTHIYACMYTVQGDTGLCVLLQLAAPFVALPDVLPSLAPAHLHTRMFTGWCMFAHIYMCMYTMVIHVDACFCNLLCLLLRTARCASVSCTCACSKGDACLHTHTRTCLYTG